MSPLPPAHKPVGHVSRWLLRSVWLRGLVFLAVLAVAGHFARPWQFGWLRLDEGEQIAEDFLIRQDAALDRYTLIRATEYRRHGAWNRLEEGTFDAGDPAVGYVYRYFADSTIDGWTVGVSPAGHIYRVLREQFEDQPDAELERRTALALTEAKMAADLGLPMERLVMVNDSLYERPQRFDWGFTFASAPPPPPQAEPDSGVGLRVELSGDVITMLKVLDTPRDRAPKVSPHRGEINRLLTFAAILVGVFIIWQFHRAPLAASAAGAWGGFVFLVILLVRAMTFQQSVLLMPTDVPYAGYLSRIALGAIVDALQAAMIVGLVVATGDSAMRDHLPRSTSITKLGRRIRSRSHAWANAARWALVAAAALLVAEVIAMRFLGPVGMFGKLPAILANSLSSPLPYVALPAQLLYDVTWDEGLYRLWLFPFTLLFFRPWLGVLVSAGLVTYWAGFDPSQIAQPGWIAYFTWNALAAALVVWSGIMAAVLFHLFVLTGLAVITVHWIGLESASLGILLGIVVGVVAMIGWFEWKEENPYEKIQPAIEPPSTLPPTSRRPFV